MPGPKPLRQAARGLALLFIVAALAMATYVAAFVLRMVSGDGRLLLFPLAVWSVLGLVGTYARWLCTRAKASLRTKWVLRLSMALSAATAMIEATVFVLLTLVLYGTLQVGED